MNTDRKPENNDHAYDLPASWEHQVAVRPIALVAPKDMAGIYARYSTANQKDASIERQVELSQEYVSRIGLRTVAPFVDRARSSMAASREGLDAMMEAAANRKFGVLVVENVDRLARDLSILSTVFRRLEALGIEMHDPKRGRLTIQDIAIQGLMGEQGRRLLLERTSFARRQMARLGLVPAGRAYGYDRIVGQPGVLALNPQQAEIVKLIFQLCQEGLSTRRIAWILNERTISPPHGGHAWSDKTITLVLQNPIYIGTLVYGRHSSTRDPQTRRETRTLLPREDWIVRAVPHLRIVTSEVWSDVQARFVARRRVPIQAPSGRASPLLLARRVHCPACGTPMHVTYQGTGRTSFRCGRFLRNRTCTHGGSVRVDEIEGAVLGEIGRRLVAGDLAVEYLAAYNEARAESDRDHAERRKELGRRVADMRRRLMESFDTALTIGFTSETLARIRVGLETDLGVAERALAVLPLPPAWATIDEGRMTEMAGSIGMLSGQGPFIAVDEAGQRLAATIREVVQRVDVLSIERGHVRFSVTLRMSSLYDAGGTTRPPVGHLVIEGIYRRTKNPRLRYDETTRADDDLASVEAGTATPCAAAYEIVDRHLDVPDFFRAPHRGLQVERRLAAEVLLHVGSIDAPWVSLPKRFGRHGAWYGRLRRLAADGTLALMLAELRDADPGRYGDGFRGLIAMRLGTRGGDVQST
ncbi:recombinase family protein [Methylobacterium sp. Leaf102]|uniref:recombinase family protein n=1 Tax=Methylobacterium sp. Leaf102 TaxID=1736253 RepID=UPI000A7F5EA9|nr:recombinase family protein [Methylobacterium sp. Leaf102]